MKKLLLAIAIALFSTSAIAQHRHYHHGHNRSHWHHNHNWVVPALISGAVVYAATRPTIVTTQQAPIVVQNQYITIDGITYKRELIIVNGISQEIWIKQ